MLKLSSPQAAFIGFDSKSLTLQSSPSEVCGFGKNDEFSTKRARIVSVKFRPEA